MKKLPVPGKIKRKYGVKVYFNELEFFKLKKLAKDAKLEWSPFIRQKLFENHESFKRSSEYVEKIEAYFTQILLALKTRPVPSKYDKIALEAEWRDAKDRHEERELITTQEIEAQKPEGIGVFLPEMKEVLKNESKGLEKVDDEILKRERPKFDNAAFRQFAELKKQRELEWATMPWKKERVEVEE